jgi:hypothetical protein
MKHKFLITAGVLLALITTGYVACAEMLPSGTWRYKITVNVETPEGLKTGSAVREVTISTATIDAPEVTASKKIIGEAVVIDLAKRGVAFAIIDSGYTDVFNAFLFHGPTTPAGIKYYRSLKAGTKAPLIKGWPRLVYFSDMSNPRSVKEIDPRNMDASFGDGVSIKDIIIEITDEPVTVGIDKWLPWLNEIGGKYLHGSHTSREAPLGLHGGNFRKREKNAH